MAADAHVTLRFTSRTGSLIPTQPEQITVTSEINKPLELTANEPCNIKFATSTTSAASTDDALDMYLKADVKEMKRSAVVHSLASNKRKSTCFAQTGRHVAKLPKTINIRRQVLAELQDLVKENGSLKSGHRGIKWYVRLLELELHGLDRSYMGDVCVLLEPLLNITKLSVLECFMSHKGLHVLCDMLQRFRPNFEARPVMRKLMKILQHLHGRNMLVVERMQCDAPQFCMEKFSKLLFDLSEHEDSEIRTMARGLQGLRFSIPGRHPSHAKCGTRGERRTTH